MSSQRHRLLSALKKKRPRSVARVIAIGTDGIVICQSVKTGDIFPTTYVGVKATDGGFIGGVIITPDPDSCCTVPETATTNPDYVPEEDNPYDQYKGGQKAVVEDGKIVELINTLTSPDGTPCE